MTKYPDLFAALAAQFSADEVKIRTQAGRQLQYITARVAMNRLDDVVGPEGWWDDYEPKENSVLCRLTIRLPDGSTLTKADAGGHAGMADSGDDEKSGYSDAFKRACVKFGVGRYLYRDGVPAFVQERSPSDGPSRTDHAPAPNGDKVYPPPTKGSALYAWAKKQGEQFDLDLVKWLDTWGRRKNLPAKFAEWSEAEIKQGYEAAVEGLNKHLLGVAGKSEMAE